MADEFEKRMREKAETLLLASAEAETPAPLSPAEIKRRRLRSARLWRTRRKREAAERKALKKKHPNRRTQMQGVPLAERLLARTEPERWYHFRELEALLPEAGRNSTHAIIYQKLPRLGWIERKQLVANPRSSWLNHTGPKSEKGASGRYKAMEASTAPKYLYRIGAKQAVERARAREKLEKLSVEGLDGKRALAAVYDDFEDL